MSTERTVQMQQKKNMLYLQELTMIDSFSLLTELFAKRLLRLRYRQKFGIRDLCITRMISMRSL